MKNNLIPVGLFALLASVGSSAVHAASCSPLPEDGASSSFGTENVTFRGDDSDACAGLDGNDNQNTGATGEAGLTSAFGGDWDFLLTDDSAAPHEGSLDSLDVTFTLTETDVNTSSGNWKLSWTGNGLPVQMDFAAVLKGGDSWGAFLFKEEVFDVSPDSGNGTWAIQFYNPGGSIPTISHFSLYVRNAKACENGDCGGGTGGGEVPVPAPLLLLGLGGALLGWRLRGAQA